MIYRSRDGLALIDRFKLYTRERNLDMLLKHTHDLTQNHLALLSTSLEKELDDLVSMPASPRYELSLSSARDDSVLKFRWFITVSLKGATKNSFDDIFKDRPKQIEDSSFRIIISSHHIGFEKNGNGDRTMTRVVANPPHSDPKSLSTIANIDEDKRTAAINDIRAAFIQWVASNCHDHAGLYLMDRIDDLDLLDAPAAPPHKKPQTARQSPSTSRRGIEFNPLI